MLRMARKLICGCAMMLLFSAAVIAQQATRVVPGKAEMEKLNFLVGEWTYTEKYEKSRMMPNGGEGKGTSRGRPGPGGHSVALEVDGTFPAGTVQALQIFTWDVRAKAYKCYAFSSDGPGMSEDTGRWENDELIFESTIEPAPAVRVRLRRVYKNIQPDSFTIQILTGPEGAELALFDTVQVQRKK
jgi:hypothetical protein